MVQNGAMTKKQLKIMLVPRGGTPLTRVQAANKLSMACSFINNMPFVVMGAVDGVGYLIPCYISAQNMDVKNSKKADNILLNFHPLTKRAV